MRPFRDAQGEARSIIDKIPLFTSADLWSDSEYPQPGLIECVVLERMTGPAGGLVRVNIGAYHFESTDEKPEFVVSEAELCD